MPASRTPRGKTVVTSVLEYLYGMERLAIITNQRTTANHFQECWRTVWCAYYGGCSVIPCAALAATTPGTKPAPTTKPAWHIAKYARPLRKVVARTTRAVPQHRGSPQLLLSYDVLECAHQLEARCNLDTGAPARHRRCPLCAQERRSQAHGKSKPTRVTAEYA